MNNVEHELLKQDKDRAQFLKEKIDLPLPIPAGGWEHYNSEREACLKTNEKRKINFEKYQSSNRSEVLDYLPIKMDIENVSRCNFRCTMCQVSEWKNGRRAKDMSFSDYKKFMDEQYGIVEIKIQGMGEPTFGGDEYYEMIKYARAERIWVRTVTNASTLHMHDNYKKLIDSGANEIQISIDGATKQTFESIRRNSNFEKVVENCKLINEYAAKQGRPYTKMWTCVQKGNNHELEQLVDLGAQMNFPCMVFSIDLTDWGQEEWNEKNSSSIISEFDQERGLSLLQRGKEKGIDVYFWYVTSKYSTKKDLGKRCAWPFERAYISSDMKIVPCCMLGNPDTHNLGDVGESFTQQWNSKVYQEFRRAHLTGEIPSVCKGCYQE